MKRFIFFNFFYYNEEQSFVQWMGSNNQFFLESEYNFRLVLYVARTRYIQEFNKRLDKTFKIGHNKFSCYTPSEYHAIAGFLEKRKMPIKQFKKTNINIEAPES